MIYRVVSYHYTPHPFLAEGDVRRAIVEAVAEMSTADVHLRMGPSGRLYAFPSPPTLSGKIAFGVWGEEDGGHDLLVAATDSTGWRDFSVSLAEDANADEPVLFVVFDDLDDTTTDIPEGLKVVAAEGMLDWLNVIESYIPVAVAAFGDDFEVRVDKDGAVWAFSEMPLLILNEWHEGGECLKVGQVDPALVSGSWAGIYITSYGGKL
jgi:hypothetical protein